MCQRVLRGIEVNDETLATELMIEKGPGQDFMMEEHTLNHMRDEFFVPKLANREKREAMAPSDDAMARARTIVQQVRSAPPTSRLPANVREQILDMYPEIRCQRTRPHRDKAERRRDGERRSAKHARVLVSPKPAPAKVQSCPECGHVGYR
jgi:trimethylamine:corrinoid methyltransferase-like protein